MDFSYSSKTSYIYEFMLVPSISDMYTLLHSYKCCDRRGSFVGLLTSRIESHQRALIVIHATIEDSTCFPHTFLIRGGIIFRGTNYQTVNKKQILENKN